ncbi:hypothetical protein BD310DRAFT_75289 [Dichomitus squalens]|uniref:Uncharacterized protein n=1 Tax=Dichomitus squalens TaxID=114155 RepID=A0A4Q9PK44_9APHY|nr:hypothetical protein BD310DRAFT_75289 [Dichomitus squalens]
MTAFLGQCQNKREGLRKLLVNARKGQRSLREQSRTGAYSALSCKSGKENKQPSTPADPVCVAPSLSPALLSLWTATYSSSCHTLGHNRTPIGLWSVESVDELRIWILDLLCCLGCESTLWSCPILTGRSTNVLEWEWTYRIVCVILRPCRLKNASAACHDLLRQLAFSRTFSVPTTSISYKEDK